MHPHQVPQDLVLQTPLPRRGLQKPHRSAYRFCVPSRRRRRRRRRRFRLGHAADAGAGLAKGAADLVADDEARGHRVLHAAEEALVEVPVGVYDLMAGRHRRCGGGGSALFCVGSLCVALARQGWG